MLNTVKLLLPALIPSWRFFDAIAPSPRIEFTLLKTAQAVPDSWQEFHPRPLRVSIGGMAKRMFWNPRANETLFLVSCAERLLEQGSEHSLQEMVKRLRTELRQKDLWLQFRLLLVNRQDEALQRQVAFTSPVYPLGESAAP